MEKLKLTATIPATPKEIYEAWLNGKKHSIITGGKATASTKVRGRFSAWADYITGHNLELHANKKIVQAWRTTEFPEAAADSLLVIKLDKKAGNKTILTLTQTGLPRGHAKKYKKGWKQHYFEPMKVYFAAK